MEFSKNQKFYEEPEFIIKRFNPDDIILTSRLTTDSSDNDNSDPFDDETFPW